MKVSSYTAGGMSSGTLGAMNISTGSMNSQIRRKSYNSQKTRKKALNYNPREISSALLRASKARSAGQVLGQARGKLASLAKAKGTGQYNDAEINAAIGHAKRMIRCAQLKTQNLRQEESMQKRYEERAKSEARQEKNKARARAVQKEQNLEQKQEIAQTRYDQKQKKMVRDLLQKSKSNRNRERNKINEADMEYLKHQMKGTREPYAYSSSYVPADGVMLELSQDGIGLSDAQIEQQAEAMINSGMAGTADTGAGAAAGGAGGAVDLAMMV